VHPHPLSWIRGYKKGGRSEGQEGSGREEKKKEAGKESGSLNRVVE